MCARAHRASSIVCVCVFFWRAERGFVQGASHFRTASLTGDTLSTKASTAPLSDARSIYYYFFLVICYVNTINIILQMNIDMLSREHFLT